MPALQAQVLASNPVTPSSPSLPSQSVRFAQAARAGRALPRATQLPRERQVRRPDRRRQHAGGHRPAILSIVSVRTGYGTCPHAVSPRGAGQSRSRWDMRCRPRTAGDRNKRCRVLRPLLVPMPGSVCPGSPAAVQVPTLPEDVRAELASGKMGDEMSPSTNVPPRRATTRQDRQVPAASRGHAPALRSPPTTGHPAVLPGGQ